MANWQFKLPLKDLWQAHEKEEITIHKLSEDVAKRLESLVHRVSDEYPDLANEAKENIVPLFEEVAELVDEMDVDDFDNALRDLYDWADTKLDNNWNGKKLCWVETF